MDKPQKGEYVRLKNNSTPWKVNGTYLSMPGKLVGLEWDWIMLESPYGSLINVTPDEIDTMPPPYGACFACGKPSSHLHADSEDEFCTACAWNELHEANKNKNQRFTIKKMERVYKGGM